MPRPGRRCQWKNHYFRGPACCNNLAGPASSAYSARGRQPARLDLPDPLVRSAIEAGVGIVVDPDAHTVDELGFIVAAGVARRGRAGRDHVLDTPPVVEVLARLGRGGPGASRRARDDRCAVCRPPDRDSLAARAMRRGDANRGADHGTRDPSRNW